MCCLLIIFMMSSEVFLRNGCVYAGVLCHSFKKRHNRYTTFFWYGLKTVFLLRSLHLYFVWYLFVLYTYQKVPSTGWLSERSGIFLFFFSKSTILILLPSVTFRCYSSSIYLNSWGIHRLRAHSMQEKVLGSGSK